MKANLARRGPRRRAVLLVTALAAVVAMLVVASGSSGATKASKATASYTPPPALVPLDPQNYKWQDTLTWSDYHALPGPDYSDPSIVPSVKRWKVAVVFTDFTDKPYAITQPAGSTIFGNPQAFAANIPRANVPSYLRDFLNTPSVTNHFQTMNRYWMEDTYGKYGVQLDAYGVYQLPGKSWQYFAQDFAPSSGTGTGCVTLAVTPCNRNFRTDTLAAWQAAAGATVQSQYDNTFYVSPGQDESGSWQEFGNMVWTQTTVPEAFGPHAYDTTLPNWMATRYVPWTSWAAGESIWPNASSSGGIPNSIEAESSGMATYAHELTHNLGIADNYNNPYGTPVQRSATGPWDMMSRGSFNGAGGPHQRFLIPSTQGSSLGSMHDLRNKVKLGFLTNSNILRLNRSGLATTGMVVAKIKAREAPPAAGELTGITTVFDGSAPVDKAPTCTNTTANPNPLCASPAFTGTSVEAVQQIGSDSFVPGHGVILAKTKTSESSSCGQFTCFVWIYDAHPADIAKTDFVDGQGVAQPVSIGDMRQLDDASFNPGTNSGTFSEFEETPNRLHYYILDKSTDASGIDSYTVGIRNLDGSGPQTRGVDATDAPAQNVANSGSFTTCNFGVNNTGTNAAVSTTAHPQGDVSQWTNQDVYRLSVGSSGAGWTAQLYNQFAHSKFGEGSSVPVYVTRTDGSAAGTTVTLTATSVSDASKTDTATCAVALDKPGVSYATSPAAPNGTNGWFTSNVGVDWTVTNANSTNNCGHADVTTDGTSNITCDATNDGGTTSVTATIKRDATKPVTGESIAPAAPDGLNGWYVTNPTITLSPADATSGVAKTEYSIGLGGVFVPYGGPFPMCSAAIPCGRHWVHWDSTDNAGNVEATNSVTYSVDLANPTSTATIAPAAQNGWYASPTVTFHGDDGANGSGIDHFTYSLDGGTWTSSAGTVAGFATGNHFIQFRAVDVSGRVETATNLIAFKADGTKPSVNVTNPLPNEVIKQGSSEKAKFKCTDNDSGIASCVGSTANGANLDTSTVGLHTLTVTATDKAGNVTTVNTQYKVIYVWNGFFNPITNESDQKLNLVHAGDLIKIGFSLNGQQAGAAFTIGSSPVACPSWAPHLIPAAGADTAPGGPFFGVASGHYTYGWQTSSGWAGTCRQFSLATNDATAAHTAVFMFFA